MTCKTNQEIGRRIQGLRIAAGLSVERLADLLAITPKFLMLIELGECNASLKVNKPENPNSKRQTLFCQSRR